MLNQFSPDFASIGAASVQAAPTAAKPGAVEAGRKVRLHVVRRTDYGDRFKLFVIIPPRGRPGQSLAQRLGLTLAQDQDDRLEVADTTFMGPGEKAGLTFGDIITDIDVEQTGRPVKEIVYLFGLAALALVLLSQARRRRRTA